MTKNVSTKDFGDNLVKKPIMATYDMLFSVVGINFGACDGYTTFNLPDLRYMFIECAYETVSRIYEVWLLNITGNTTYNVYGEYDDAEEVGEALPELYLYQLVQAQEEQGEIIRTALIQTAAMVAPATSGLNILTPRFNKR